MRFVYSIARFVPDPGTGECVNVGLVVGDGQQWAVKQVSNLQRARALDGRGRVDAVRRVLDDLQEGFDEVGGLDSNSADDDGSPHSWLLSLQRRHRNLVQFSDPLPVAAEDLDAALAILADELLVDPEARTYGETRTTARASLRRALRNAIAGASLREDVTLVAGERHDVGLDFAVVNGSVLQLSQAWSFATRSSASAARDVRAWAWVIDALRDEGGYLLGPDGRRDVPREVPVEVYCVGGGDADPAYQSALAAFDRLEIPVRTDPAEIAVDAAALLHH